MSARAARLTANRENAMHSSGPKSEEGKAISSQNRLTHGLARHNGRFALLPAEHAAEFDELRAIYMNEHAPLSQTETDLVHAMVESLWMRNRAQTSSLPGFDPNTGAVSNPKLLALFIRYENTYHRAFSTAFKDLLKARAERRKVELGFEAQKRRQQAELRAQEKYQMQKDKHYWEVFKADGEACNQAHAQLTPENGRHQSQPEFLGAVPCAAGKVTPIVRLLSS